MATSAAPIDIGRVTLRVRDLARAAAFYERDLGLAPLSRDGEAATFGTEGRTLLELRRDRHARPAAPGDAGLFHIAWLLPSRADLAAWLVHAARTGVGLEGASDHAVSEALYLSDPEGNGVEIYVDRPRNGWTGPDGRIRMTTDPLDLDGLAAAARRPWSGAPEETVVGHVHLSVGALDPAVAFYADRLGLDVTARYPGARFFSSGGYHHHLAANVWRSRGAGPADPGSAGLEEVELRADPAAHDALTERLGGAAEVADPWGARLRLSRKPAEIQA